MRTLLILFLLVLSLKVSRADSLAFDNCESLGIENCDEFRELNIPVDEQKKLFSSLLEIRDDKSIHDFIFDWNTNLAFDEIPYSVLPHNYRTIENAWLSLSCIMPSVLYNDQLYNNYSGYAQTNYGYELTRPNAYFNGDWELCTKEPPTSPNEGEGSDCRTEYPQNWDVSNLYVYLNGKRIGNSSLVFFNITSSTNSFESELNIVNKIQRKHYRWEQGNCCKCKHCCWKQGRRRKCGSDCGKCGCDTHRQHCQASFTDYRYDAIVLKDNKESLLERANFSEPVILYDKAKGMAYFILNTTNADNYKLSIDEFELIKKNLDYSYNYSYLPVNVLTAKANYSPEINANVYSTLGSLNNSDLISFYLESKDSYDCKMELNSYFNSFNLACNVTVLPSTELNITTDKFFYMPNETIKANISIKSDARTNNDVVSVSYGNYSFNVLGSAMLEIPAQQNANQIRAEYETDLTHQSASAVKTISVYSGENPKFYASMFWMVISFLFFISALRMCWIKFYGVKNE